jgi:hypothetical protein
LPSILHFLEKVSSAMPLVIVKMRASTMVAPATAMAPAIG